MFSLPKLTRAKFREAASRRRRCPRRARPARERSKSEGEVGRHEHGGRRVEHDGRSRGCKLTALSMDQCNSTARLPSRSPNLRPFAIDRAACAGRHSGTSLDQYPGRVDAKRKHEHPPAGDGSGGGSIHGNIAQRVAIVSYRTLPAN